jgi:flagellar motor switch protein FliN/FliY
VPAPQAHLEWLRDEFASRLASVFETMAGERPSFSPAAPAAPPAAGLLWCQPFQGIAGELWVAAAEPVWTLAAQQVLRAAGMEDADRETLQSTYLEIIGQALGGLAQAITARLGREVTPGAGTAIPLAADQKPPEAPPELAWEALDFTFGAGLVSIHLGPEAALLDAITPPAAEETRTDDATDAAPASKTFDLLLDVELPVSVSFGRAHVPLKDVLKLTTGSIVELNRSIVEPVEVIVNNCVIARGEVVVVEGNFGVRIQHVVSRQERLRTLN